MIYNNDNYAKCKHCTVECGFRLMLLPKWVKRLPDFIRLRLPFWSLLNSYCTREDSNAVQE